MLLGKSHSYKAHQILNTHSYIYLIKFVVILSSCSPEKGTNENEIRVDTTYYENGIQRSIYKTINGKKDSIETEYYQSSKLKSIIEWVNGRPTGIRIDFFDGVENTYLTQVEDDTVIVNEYQKSFFGYLNDEDTLYYLRYNKEGDIIEEGGTSIILVNNINERKVLQIYSPFPENIDSKLEVRFLDGNMKIIFSQIFEYDAENSSFFIPYGAHDFDKLIMILSKVYLLQPLNLKTDTLELKNSEIAK